MTSKNIKITQRQEENIISTICGNTTPGQRRVNAEWVALASGVRDVDKVKAVIKKYDGKIEGGEINLNIKNGKMGVAYGVIRTKREKELKQSLKKKSVAKEKAVTKPKKESGKKLSEKAKVQHQTSKPSSAVEIVGFDKALKRSETSQLIKKINREALNKRVKELTDQGVPKDVAKAYAQVEREYHLKRRS